MIMLLSLRRLSVPFLIFLIFLGLSGFVNWFVFCIVFDPLVFDCGYYVTET